MQKGAVYEAGYTGGQSKNEKRCHSIMLFGALLLLEAAFIIIVITRLNEYAEIVNLLTRVFAGILVLALYASDQTSSMKMPWIILILVFPIMGVALYLLIGLNGGTRKMRERYADIDRKLLPLLRIIGKNWKNIKNKTQKQEISVSIFGKMQVIPYTRIRTLFIMMRR